MIKIKASQVGLKVAIHAFVWMALILIPVVLLPEDEFRSRFIWREALIPLILYALIFYTNYFVLIPKYLFNKKYLIFSGINLVQIVVLTFLMFEFLDLFSFQFEPPKFAGELINQKNKPAPPIALFRTLKALTSFIPVGFAVAVKAVENRHRLDFEKKEIENQNIQSELQHLKFQLHPHFFFNSLNNIHSLVEESKLNAQAAIHDLSGLMRYLLRESGTEKVPLKTEIDFLVKYIQLMEIRQNDRVETTYHFPPSDTLINYQIYPFLLIPLIENAYKHGIGGKEHAALAFFMEIENERLIFIVENTKFPSNPENQSGSGIGLKNLKKRLALLYREKYKIDIEETEDVFTVQLEINLVEDED
ncbi:MAG: histidine kinase [Bacteroidetes bacterium]|nr:histidine kinase [Bacteroidota bacterium]